MGWSVDLECLTAWADYDVYPQIVNWEVLEMESQIRRAIALKIRLRF